MNQLKQLGIALHNYESTNRYFPAINSPSGMSNGRSYSGHYYSPLARLLQDLEQAPLYNSINFSGIPSSSESLSANNTAMLTSMALFVCPSDPPPPVRGYGRANYRFSVGPSPLSSPSQSAADSFSGPFTVHYSRSPSDFPDGLSNTIGASERLQGDWVQWSFKRGGDYYMLGVDTADRISTPELAISLCANADPSGGIESKGGESWFLSGLHFTNYNHVTPPNSRITDCVFDRLNGDLHSRTLHDGIMGASSNHPGGVNTLAMDGSVRFVRDGVDPRAWRAMSTRDGSEVVTFDE